MAADDPVRWLFGDRLGPHFVEDFRGEVLMVESRAVLARRRFHRQKAHLVLSAMRHRAREVGDRVDYRRAEAYGPAVRRALTRGGGRRPLQVVHPTSYAAVRLVDAAPRGAAGARRRARGRALEPRPREPGAAAGRRVGRAGAVVAGGGRRRRRGARRPRPVGVGRRRGVPRAGPTWTG